MTERLRRVLWALRHPIRVYGPRCGSHGPWRLADCGPCIAPRGHEHHGGPSPDWHADGTGYIWNDVEGRWRWMGPPVSVEDAYDLPPEAEHLQPFALHVEFCEDPAPLDLPGIDLTTITPLPHCPDHDERPTEP